MIVCENLVKIYSLSGVEVMALQGLDLAVQDGEMLGIVGASGSGKTTLMNVLGGLDRPTAGRVTVFERELLKLSDDALDVYRRTQVGFVWQQASRNLVPYLTALENVELPLRLAHLPAAERQSRALELLETLGISDRLHHRPDQLSGGEQQRVAIGVAMANRPLLILADEPTGELDTATSVDIFNALRKVNTLYHATTIIVSHDSRIGQFVDRVVVIRDGRTSSETVQKEFRSQDLEFRFSPQPAPGKQVNLPATAGDASDSKNAPTKSEPVPAFDDLVILDSAGRMQIPREFLERLNIGDRVRLELDGNHIAIQPVEGHGRAPVEPETELPGPEDLYVEAEDAAPTAKQNSLRERLRRLSRRMRRKSGRSGKS